MIYVFNVQVSYSIAKKVLKLIFKTLTHKFIMNKFYLFAFSEALCPAILPNVVVIEIDDPLAGYSL